MRFLVHAQEHFGQSNRLFARRCAHARVATLLASRIDLSEAIMSI